MPPRKSDADVHAWENFSRKKLPKAVCKAKSYAASKELCCEKLALGWFQSKLLCKAKRLSRKMHARKELRSKKVNINK
jgi:hypothetical protein